MSKILIVDDEAYISTQLEEWLISMRYEVIGRASSGEASIDMARSLHPDLVLMDIVMPGKMDGIEAAEIIKKEVDIPVVFLTAYAEDDLIQRAKHVEPCGYIVKPFQESEIKAAIEVALYKKNTERRMRESEKKYRLLVNNIPSIVFTGYKDWSIDFIDNKIETLTGYAMEDFNSRRLKWIDIVVKDDIEEIKRIFTEALKDNKTYIREYRIKSKKGEIIWIQQRGQMICDNHGEVLYVSGVLFDISNHKQAEEQLKQYSERLEEMVEQRTKELKDTQEQLVHQEKLAATGRMAARIAHEINNPLAGIKNSFKLIKAAIAEEHPYYHYVGRIDKEIERISHIVHQMFDLYRTGQESVREFPLQDAIHDVIAMMKGSCRDHDVKITVEVSGSPVIVSLPEGYLTQVLFNIIQNSIDASPRGGMVKITATVTEDRLGISVADQGSGIPEEFRPQIFEPFFTTRDSLKNGGLGLGLSVSKSLVESMGGSIDFESKEGRGTVFRINLPLGRVPKKVHNG